MFAANIFFFSSFTIRDKQQAICLNDVVFDTSCNLHQNQGIFNAKNDDKKNKRLQFMEFAARNRCHTIKLKQKTKKKIFILTTSNGVYLYESTVAEMANDK